MLLALNWGQSREKKSGNQCISNDNVALLATLPKYHDRAYCLQKAINKWKKKELEIKKCCRQECAVLNEKNGMHRSGAGVCVRLDVNVDLCARCCCVRARQYGWTESGNGKKGTGSRVNRVRKRKAECSDKQIKRKCNNRNVIRLLSHRSLATTTKLE